MTGWKEIFRVELRDSMGNAIRGFRVLSLFRFIRKYEVLGELLGLL